MTKTEKKKFSKYDQRFETYEKILFRFLINGQFCTQNSGPVLVKDLQTPAPSKRADFLLLQKVAQCSETNEKSIFQLLLFLFFELWSIVLTIYMVGGQSHPPIFGLTFGNFCWVA